ncbi:MAG TPA: diiron oxygenase [Polyangiales bacterium]
MAQRGPGRRPGWLPNQEKPVHAQYDYEQVLSVSERVAFHIDEVLAPGARFDFTRPFLPETLARVEGLSFLTPRERLCLNQIRAHAYLGMFGTVEEFILPFVLDHARAELSRSDARTRALLQFAGEEAKHIDLFRRFCARFQRDFGSACELVGPAQAVARSVLAQGPLAVALTILHIEWMTQRHYIESVKNDQQLEPQFQKLLKYHYLEECQHAKLDTLMVLELARDMKPAEVTHSVGDYLSLIGAFDALLAQQVELDVRSLERAQKRALSQAEWEATRSAQLAAARFTFLGTGMTHPNFLETLDSISPASTEKVLSAARQFL